jgi:glycine hydroxymethyltransferase
MVTSGIRVGTPAITTRGMAEDEVRDVARWMCDVMDDLSDGSTQDRVREQVRALCRRFPVYGEPA